MRGEEDMLPPMDPKALHREALVIDGHTDVPTRLYWSPADLSQRLTDGHVDLPRLREGGVTAPVFALFIPPMLSAEAGLGHARDLFSLIEEQLRPGELELAVSVEEVRRAKRKGHVSILLGLENGRPLSLPGALEEMAKLGVRYITATHTATHEWCDASTDEARHGGLSKEGEEIVWRMTKLGIVPDVSHVSDDAVRHILDVSKIPVIASHSSARALCDHPRNLPDELVREIAARGGVVMANCYPAFLDDRAAAANRERTREMAPLVEEMAAAGGGRRGLIDFARKRQAFLAERPLPAVALSVFVDHVMHLLSLAGEEHVGIGTDFDGIEETPEGFDDAAAFPALTAELLRRGVSAPGVRLVLGENFLRVLEQAERQGE